MHDGAKAEEMRPSGHEKPEKGSAVEERETGIDLTRYRKVDVSEDHFLHCLCFNTAQALIFSKALRKAAVQYRLEGDEDTSRYLLGLCDGLLKLL